MRQSTKILLTGLVGANLATFCVRGATLYQLDNNTISTALNASDGTEPLDNWVGNVFTAAGGFNRITAVDLGVFTTSPNSVASVSLYRVTGAGGNPALGATRLYTQSFTPLVGNNTNAFLQQINLTTPVDVNDGDKFLVSVLIRNVLAAPPNDVYPFLLDTSGVAAGTFWGRSAPNTFNVDNLSGIIPINQAFVPGGFTPGAGHIFLRAEATVVPEPASAAMCVLGLTLLIGIRQRRR